MNLFPFTSAEDLAEYIEIYKDLHQHPELSYQEGRTASAVTEHLETLDFRIEEGIGGNGVVGVFHNGPGETVLLRSELDALPITEETYLPYASEFKQVDADGILNGVMHAGAHDMHMTCLLAVAEILEESSMHWSGTVILLFQPDAEGLGGAMAVVNDSLFRKIPYPTICLSQHCVSTKSRTIAVKSDRVLAYLDSLHVRVYGRDTNRPQPGARPVLPVHSIISGLKRIRVREINPKEPVFIGCKNHRGGTDANGIPNEEFDIEVRSFSENTRKLSLDTVKGLIQKRFEGSSLLSDARLVVNINSSEINNDEKATGQFIQTLKEYYGNRAPEIVQETSPDVVADDFLLALNSGEKPALYLLEHWIYSENRD
ncbi:hypothetical protein N7488_007275 [Penicillium malachiteum]|nr:hypothetical protein N7488_007275 [Penicillium malachiteum]